MAAILSLEFLVHAWDYASKLDRLAAFTGRVPVSG
jgi:hypothetical protein